MKVILIDYCNDGIIYVGDSVAVANQLKKGLVDTDIYVLYPFDPGFNAVNRKEIFEGTQHLSLNWKTLAVSDMSEESKNPIYIERRRLCKLRARVMERLVQYTFTASLTNKITVWDGFENNLRLALEGCNDQTETYSNPILEYAYINNIEPSVAYREIKLQVENIESIKMKIYSYQKYFADKINSSTTEEDVEAVRTEMIAKFTDDNNI